MKGSEGLGVVNLSGWAGLPPPLSLLWQPDRSASPGIFSETGSERLWTAVMSAVPGDC